MHFYCCKASKVGLLINLPLNASVWHTTDCHLTTDFNGKPVESGREARVPSEESTYLEQDSIIPTHALVKQSGVGQLALNILPFEDPLDWFRMYRHTCYINGFILIRGSTFVVHQEVQNLMLDSLSSFCFTNMTALKLQGNC